MNTIISGQAGTAFVLDGKAAWSVDIEEPDVEVPRRPAEFSRVFAGVSDAQFFENVSRADVVRRLREAVDGDMALYLTLMLFEDDTGQDIKVEAVFELEELLKRDCVLTYVQNVLFSHALPDSANREQAIPCCKPDETPRALEFIERLLQLQPTIENVRAAWERIPVELFDSEEYTAHCRAVFVRQGLFRALTLTIAQGESLGEFRYESLLNPEIRKVRNHAQILSGWAAPFREAGVGTLRYKVEAETVDGRQEEDSWNTATNPDKPRRKSIDRKAVLAKVEIQKRQIVDAMRRRNFERVDTYTNVLVKYNMENGGPEYAAKTLCDLAMSAKQLGLLRLQLELSERSTRLMPEDPQTWTQYADALLGLNRLPDALEAYRTVLRDHPGDVVAKNGFAEVLKAMNQLPEALEAYQTVLRDHPENVVAKNGFAEVLKAMNRLPEALEAYQTVLHDHPGDVFAKNGFAEVLKAMNRLPEALEAYRTAMHDHPGDVVAKNGFAEVLKAMNRLPEALEAYQTVLRDHPENVVAKNGFAEVLKAMNRLREALEAYQTAMRDHPESVVAKTGFAEVLKAMNRLPEALEAYRTAMRDHPESVVAKCGFAEVLKAMNQLPEALEAYRTAMRDHPESVVAKNGYACLLAIVGRYDEALALLPESSPITAQDWIGYHIRGMILLGMGSIGEAIGVFEKGVRENPRVDSADYFRTALAMAQMRQKEYQAACATLAEISSLDARGPADVLRVHALGELRSDAVGAAYARIAGELPPDMAELRDEIGRLFVTGEQPRHDMEWVYQQECMMLMAVMVMLMMRMSLRG
jgi:tetratricopeptide (TPR) repeat protein